MKLALCLVPRGMQKGARHMQTLAEVYSLVGGQTC